MELVYLQLLNLLPEILDLGFSYGLVGDLVDWKVEGKPVNIIADLLLCDRDGLAQLLVPVLVDAGV